MDFINFHFVFSISVYSPHSHPDSHHSHPDFPHSHPDSHHSYHGSDHSHPDSPHSHPNFPHSHPDPPHSHPDSPHSHHSLHSVPRFPIPAFIDSLVESYILSKSLMTVVHQVNMKKWIHYSENWRTIHVPHNAISYQMAITSYDRKINFLY